jgi:SAM-dependent methyltransferase
MNWANLKGLCFPDECLIRFFFKMGLHDKKGSALELGCGNGNNLLLFREFGWNTVGVDVNAQSLQDGDFNFRQSHREDCIYSFILHDLSGGLEGVVSGTYEVGLIPNVLCYIPRDKGRVILKEMEKLLKPGAYVYLRTRSVKDYRFGRGEQIGLNSFRLATPETNEEGLINVFYHEYELVDMMRDELHLDTSSMTILWIDFQSIQKGVLVNNSDIVIWGKTLE